MLTRPIGPAGRAATLPILCLANINSVTAILDHPQVRHLRAGDGEPIAAPPDSRPATLLRRGSVVALRQRRAIALGSLADRAVLTSDHLVTAHDDAGHPWWIPADAVWSDADEHRRPEHPRPIGLATAGTREAALINGLSDRLGWEAVLELDRGGDLPAVPAANPASVPNAIVLDGRLNHAVPTVVVLAADTIRWGAGSTWDGAMRRALYGDDPLVDPSDELARLGDLLAGGGLAVASVDLGTPRLLAAGVVRCSVQIVAHNAVVRSWDADSVK